MFDFIYRRKRVVQFILALITLPFAFFGVNYYFRSASGGQEVATVAGHEISQQEFAVSLREQQQRMRQVMGRNFDPAMFDDPEMRYAVLEQLINERLLEDQARRDRLRVSDAQLAQFIADGFDPRLFDQIDFERGRVKPRTLFNFSTGIDLRQSERVALSLAMDVQNLTDRLYVYNFESVFSGTHIGPPRQWSGRLTLKFK